MAQPSDLPFRERIAAGLSEGLRRARTPLIIIVAVGVAFVIGYTIYSEVNKKRVDRATALAATVQTDFSNWQNATAAKKKQQLETKLSAGITNILKDYPGTYAAQRALFLRADLAYHKKEWKQAQTAYEQLAKQFPQSYLAPLSLTNAAAAAEESGNPKKAIALDKQILTFKGIVPEIPRAIFSLGRLYEGQGDLKQADTYYKKLVSSYPSSGWTSLARDRMIYLAAKNQGKIPGLNLNPTGSKSGSTKTSANQGKAPPLKLNPAGSNSAGTKTGTNKTGK